MCVALAFMGALHTLAKDVVDYVNPLVGTESKFELSTGNTYPAIAMPWGMNFWMPQTGRMGDGWAYVYWHDDCKSYAPGFISGGFIYAKVRVCAKP